MQKSLTLGNSSKQNNRSRSAFAITRAMKKTLSASVGCWVPSVGDVAVGKMPYFLEFGNETCRKWSLGIDAGTEYVYFEFRHQGDELFSAEGRKMAVLSVFKGF